MDKLLTVPEAVHILKVSKSTVYRLCARGLPHTKKSFGLRFRQTDLENWLEQDKRQALLADNILKKALTIPTPVDIDVAKGGKEVARTKSRRNYSYGSVYKRKHCRFWSIDYYDADGNRIQKVIKGAVHREEAHEELKKVIFDAYFGKQGKNEQKGQITFKELADMYFSDWAKNNKLGSWKTDEGRIKKMKEFFKDASADSITSQDIEKFRAQKREDGLKLTTINKYVQILSKLFNCGISWGYLKENPCKGVRKYPEEPYRRTRVLSREEETRLMKAIGPAHLRSMIKILLNSGLRRKELFQLTWDCVDFKKRQLFIRETKTSRSRYVPMNETVYNELRELYWSRTDDGLVFRNPKTGKHFVCIRKTFNSACKKAKVENLNLLDIRRTFASRLLEAGADIITVQQLLGHTSVKTTQIYTISNADQKLKAVSLLDPNKALGSDKLVTNFKDKLVSYGFSAN